MPIYRHCRPGTDLGHLLRLLQLPETYTRFTHHCGVFYDELKVVAEKYDFRQACDGLKVED